MRTIYVGGYKNKSSGKTPWKIYFSLALFLAITCSVLKVAAPTLVEKWINKNGAGKAGYAFSIRDAGLSMTKGRVILNDVKVFNPETNTEFIESPEVTINFNVADLLFSQEKKISVMADQADLILSKDLSAEIARIKSMTNEDINFYLNEFDGKVGKLNIIEQKEDQSRTIVELAEVNLKAKNFTPLSINKKSEFILTSALADGGKLSLTGKTSELNGDTPWSIKGSFKEVPSDILNKIAGDKLPFSFNEPKLNAEITAHSEKGVVRGEILPDVKRLNLIEEKPGIPTQTIARALSDELTFTLPFTLKDDLKLQYADTFSKLRNYRKYAGTSDGRATAPVRPVTQQTAKSGKSSFWPF